MLERVKICGKVTNKSENGVRCSVKVCEYEYAALLNQWFNYADRMMQIGGLMADCHDNRIAIRFCISFENGSMFLD